MVVENRPTVAFAALSGGDEVVDARRWLLKRAIAARASLYICSSRSVCRVVPRAGALISAITRLIESMTCRAIGSAMIRT